ncbi:MAG: histidine phosphatase family protein [Pseudomonadota bacterium]|nr:histidine phosphatase family protein [Pseudomonadota bacterium]
MPQLYIVRHGNTFDKGDRVTRVGARTDLALSTSGQTQARALAEHFRDEGIHFGGAIAGPLKRTRETAETIVADQPPGLEIRIEDFLREVDYGPDENQPEAAVVDRIGQAALDAWEAEATPPPGWKVDPDALIQDWKNFFAEVGAFTSETNVLAVTSNGIARFALLAAGADGEGHSLKLKTGAYGILKIRPDGSAYLEDWNVSP